MVSRVTRTSSRELNMTRLYRTILYILIVALTTTAARGQAPAFHLAFNLETPRVSLLEPVYVTVTVDNQSEEIIQGNFDRGTYAYVITGPDRTVTRAVGFRAPAIPQYFNPDGDNGPLPQLLARPHQTATVKLLLNESYAFRAPGTYRIEIQPITQFRTAYFAGRSELVVSNGKPVQPSVRGNSIVVQIDPRDESRLRSTCAKLAEDSLKSDWAARRQAALTLSYIEDPIAVPFLKRVLKEGEGTSIPDYAVDGLVRIATLESVNALVDAARTNTSLQSRIRAGLQIVELTTKDERVKAQIRAFER